MEYNNAPQYQYIDEIETLLQTNFFYDAERSDALYNDASLFEPSEIGARQTIGISALRIIAEERYRSREAAKRANPDLDVASWNASQRLTAPYIGKIAFQYQEEVRHLSRQLAVINTAEQALIAENKRTWAEGLFPQQHPYLEDILKSVQKPPERIEVERGDGKREVHYMRGTTVVAPTAFGKTVLMARAARGLGAGLPIEGINGDTKPLRILIIAPTQLLVNQIAGHSGDRTFERFAGVKPSRYFQHEKDDQKAIVAITIDTYLKDFRDGKLNDEEFDILMIDEAHHLTAPKLQETVLKHWRGPILGFTATPDYSETKDVRLLLPNVIRHFDTISSIREGILNGAQLFTLLVRPEDLTVYGNEIRREHLDKPVIDFLTPHLQAGRRGIVFCAPVDGSFHAKHLAVKLSNIDLPSGRKVRAKAIGYFNRKKMKDSNADIIDRYHSGEIDVLTTVEMGREGLNGAFDFVVIHADVSSMLKLTQIIGRGPRISERFPYTVYMQVIAPSTMRHRKPTLIYEAFGLERIEQGIRIGPGVHLDDDEHKETPSDAETYPPAIAQMLERVEHIELGQALIGKTNESVVIPPDYIPLHEIIQGKDIGPAQAKYELTVAGYDWKGRLEDDLFIRYYEPDAANHLFGRLAFFSPHSGGKKRINLPAFSRHVGLHRATIEDTIKGKLPLYVENGIRYIVGDDIPKAEQIITEKYPLSMPNDINMAELADELGVSLYFLREEAKRRKIIPQYRRHKFSDRKHQRTITHNDAEILRGIVQAIPKASDLCMSRPKMGAAFNMTYSQLGQMLTAEEKEWLTPMWTKTKDEIPIILQCWSEEHSAAVFQRIKAYLERNLPPHVVQVSASTAFVRASVRKVRGTFERSDKGGLTVESLIAPGYHAPQNCLTWSSIAKLQERYGRPAGVPKIDPERLPASADDTDPERIAYARALQAKYMNEKYLGFDPALYRYNK